MLGKRRGICLGGISSVILVSYRLLSPLKTITLQSYSTSRARWRLTIKTSLAPDPRWYQVARLSDRENRPCRARCRRRRLYSRGYHGASSATAGDVDSLVNPAKGCPETRQVRSLLVGDVGGLYIVKETCATARKCDYRESGNGWHSQKSAVKLQFNSGAEICPPTESFVSFSGR